jgi:hypothetical protein
VTASRAATSVCSWWCVTSFCPIPSSWAGCLSLFMGLFDDAVAAQRAELSALSPEFVGGELGSRLAELALPALRLRPVPAGSGGGWRSCLGGDPVLLSDAGWPAWTIDGSRVPLSLLARIDLSEIAEFGGGLDLPPDGWLNFFYDTGEQPWGGDPRDREACLLPRPRARPCR